MCCGCFSMPTGMGILLFLNLVGLILDIIALVNLFSYTGGFVYGGASLNIVTMLIILAQSVLIIMWMNSKDRAVDRLLLVRAMRVGLLASVLGIVYSVIVMTNMPKTEGVDSNQLILSSIIGGALNFLLCIWWHQSAMQFHAEKVKVERGG